MDPSQISADWAEARFGGPNLVALIKKSIKKFITLDFSDFNLEDDSLAPDGGVFYYPDEGIGALPEAFAKEAKKTGTHIELNVTPTSINRRDKKITYLKSGKTKIVSYKTLVSTIPLFSLYQLIGEKKHIVEQEFSKTKYMDIIFVYVFLKKDRVSADHWLYFPDPEIPFNRAVEFGNWSKRMVPEGKTSVCLDITCYYGDQIWNSSDKELSESCIQSADNIGYFKKEDVIDTYVHRVRYAYPVYDRDYKKRLETIVSFLEKKDLYLLGRTGIFRYNNSDNSIEMAFQLAKNLLTNSKKKSLFNYEIKNASL
jgi:protoporphyrinogen oxidase